MGVLIYLCCCEGNWPGYCCWSVCWRISSSLSTCYCETGKAIVLDNAQFKLTKSSVEVAWENAIRDPDDQSHIAEQRIKWSLIVQLSPWMGGFYERLVGISKMALRKAIGKTCLTMLQLQTFLTETEAIINSRPLVYLGEDLNDSTALTPSHFLSANNRYPLDHKWWQYCRSYILPGERDTRRKRHLSILARSLDSYQTAKIKWEQLKYYWRQKVL